MQAYILAAGKGRRAGGPKAWLERDGKPLMSRQLEFALSRFGGRELAVSVQKEWLDTSSATWRMMKPWSEKGVAFVAVDSELSALSSLQSLLRARPALSPFFVWHVDQPVRDRRLFDALGERIHTMAEHSFDTVEGARPVFEGKGGHPVLLAPELALKILALNPVSERLDVFLKSRAIADVAVDAACCVENWNTPEAFDSCRQEFGAAK